MKFKRFLLWGTVLLGIVAAVSCKKDDEETTDTESFTGSVSFELPTFISPGEVYTLHIDGISREDDGSWGCCWNVDVTSETDTTRLESDPASVSGDFVFAVPDTLCTVTVKASVFAEGYATTSKSLSATIVSDSKENGSLVGRSYDAKKDFIYHDGRDGKNYWCTTIGDREWFRENLAWAEGGYPYGGSANMEQIMGCYYSWNEAQSACPDGWRLPDSEDWSALAKELSGKDFTATETFTGIAGKLMADVYFNGDRMWEYWPKVNITDSSRFSAIPAGYSIKKGDDDYTFTAYCKYATFWVNDTYGDKVLYRYLYVDKTDCFVGTAEKDDFLLSVRCVRDVK